MTIFIKILSYHLGYLNELFSYFRNLHLQKTYWIFYDPILSLALDMYTKMIPKPFLYLYLDILLWDLNC